MNTVEKKSQPKPKRQRAIAGAADGIGMHRYSLYVAAMSRIKKSMEDAYFLEAITLIESILTDRLESRATFLTGQNQGFKNLHPLISILKEEEKSLEFRAIIPNIDQWRERRNKAVHELVKFEHGTLQAWNEKVAGLKSIADDGLGCLRGFDKIDKRERRKNGARIAATEPNAFR